jgi:hypothetical protein
VFSTGDYNGDGYDDLAVGDPEQQRVLIYPGSPAGPQTATPIVLRGNRGFGMWVM